MGELQEGFTQFWETITGVLDDDQSKLIRIMCFFTLFLGIVWAGLSYFRAERIANVSEELSSSYVSTTRRGNNQAMEKLMAAAQTVATMRNGGEAIARQISEANIKPFNLDGYNEIGIEDLSGVSEFSDNPENAAQRDERQKPAVLVKALMLSGRSRYAVIEFAGEKGKVIRQGQKLPDGEGRVVRITKEGLTVKYDDDEITYSIQ